LSNNGLPLVSVVIPTRARGELLARALRSVYGQTETRFEVVVVGDGPGGLPEGPMPELQHPACRVIELPQRRGGSAARNAGVAAARGRWIALLDDDDEWYPHKLAAQLAASARLPCAEPIIGGCVLVKTPHATFSMPRRPPREGEPLSEYLIVRHGLFHSEGLIQTSTIMATRELLLRVPFDETLVRLQELDWLLRANAEADTCIRILMDRLAVWHQDGDGERVSDVDDWPAVLAWLARRPDLFTRRAHTALITSTVADMAASTRDPRVFKRLLMLAFRCGPPRPLDLATYLQIWLLPRGARRWIHDLALGRLNRRVRRGRARSRP
jgi:glycosyltransferase involved in cell wall biosynthesis